MLWATNFTKKICRIVRHPKSCLRLLWATSASLVDVVGVDLYVELYVELYARLYAAISKIAKTSTKDVGLYDEVFVTHPRL